MAYPASITTFPDPSGTSLLTSPDHAALHSSVNDTVEALENTLGTTSGTAVLRFFTANDTPVRMQGVASNGTVQGTLSIPIAIISNLTGTTGFLSGMVITTASISNSTLSLSQFSGTASLAAGTATNLLINTPIIGTPATTGGTITNSVYSGGTATAAITNLPYVLDRSTSLGTVVNTTVDTAIYSLAVAGNTLGTTKMLRLTLLATYLQNSGGAADLIASIKYGATTLGTALATNSAAGTAPAALRIEAYLMNIGTTNVQRGGFTFLGRHQPINQANVVVSGYGVAAEDSTASKTFAISIAHGTASADLSFIKNFAILEVV